jgi:hypothetical protein
MNTLDIACNGKCYPVPKKLVSELLNHDQTLIDAKTYPVQSSVSTDVFESFVNSLKSETKITVTRENAVSLWLLATEFFLPDLATECSAFSVPIDQFSSLVERVSELERQLSSIRNAPGKIEDDVDPPEVKKPRLPASKSQTSSRPFDSPKSGRAGERQPLSPKVEVRGSKSKDSPRAGKAPASPELVRRSPERDPESEAEPESPVNRVEIPMKTEKSLDGIISYLTKKHGGNVHEKGIVTITSKSIYHENPLLAPPRVADFTSDDYFCSHNAPGEWLCWDFGEMRIRPTNYAVKDLFLRSWVLQGSLDGKSWTEIDRQRDNQDFQKLSWASFTVSNPAEFRFIRLTQTDKSYGRADILVLHAVEFFGTLSE